MQGMGPSSPAPAGVQATRIDIAMQNSTPLVSSVAVRVRVYLRGQAVVARTLLSRGVQARAGRGLQLRVWRPCRGAVKGPGPLWTTDGQALWASAKGSARGMMMSVLYIYSARRSGRRRHRHLGNMAKGHGVVVGKLSLALGPPPGLQQAGRGSTGSSMLHVAPLYRRACNILLSPPAWHAGFGES